MNIGNLLKYKQIYARCLRYWSVKSLKEYIYFVVAVIDQSISFPFWGADRNNSLEKATEEKGS